MKIVSVDLQTEINAYAKYETEWPIFYIKDVWMKKSYFQSQIRCCAPKRALIHLWRQNAVGVIIVTNSFDLNCPNEVRWNIFQPTNITKNTNHHHKYDQYQPSNNMKLKTIGHIFAVELEILRKKNPFCKEVASSLSHCHRIRCYFILSRNFRHLPVYNVFILDCMLKFWILLIRQLSGWEFSLSFGRINVRCYVFSPCASMRIWS